jgi:hypothetical protein
VALAVPVFVAAIVIEFVINRTRRTDYYHLADAINSLGRGIISTGMRVFFGFLGLFVYDWLLQHAALVHLSASSWLTWVFAFFAYDFCYYTFARERYLPISVATRPAVRPPAVQAGPGVQGT